MERILGTAVVNAAILYNQRQLEAALKRMKIASFCGELCHCLMQINQKANDDQESFNHKLQETTEREAGKRSDRRIRQYCIGCYAALSESVGRARAKMKAKRVTTECCACNREPRFCFDCFAKFHVTKPGIVA